MTLFEIQKEIKEIHRTLGARTGHTVDQAQRMLSNLEKKVEEEAKRREKFEETVLKRV